MKIIDLVTLDAFMRELVEAQPSIDFYLPLSNAEKAVDEISAYYTNDYMGTTAFLQIAEATRADNLITFMCSLTIAMKPADVSARAGLVARDQTLKLMLELLGSLQLKADESVQEVEDEGDMYDLVITPDERIFPIGMLANVNLEGHYVDLDITVPAHHLLYPA